MLFFTTRKTVLFLYKNKENNKFTVFKGISTMLNLIKCEIVR